MGLRWKKKRGVCLDLLLLLLVGLNSREVFAWAQQAPQQTVRPVHHTELLGVYFIGLWHFIYIRKTGLLSCVHLSAPAHSIRIFLSKVFALMRDPFNAAARKVCNAWQLRAEQGVQLCAWQRWVRSGWGHVPISWGGRALRAACGRHRSSAECIRCRTQHRACLPRSNDSSGHGVLQ